MPRYDRIEISGYKSIRTANLRLEPLNVLVGPNGAGKSNLLSLLELVNQVDRPSWRESVARLGGANRLLHFGTIETPRMEVTLSTDMAERRISLVPSAGDSLNVFNSQIVFRSIGGLRRSGPESASDDGVSEIGAAAADLTPEQSDHLRFFFGDWATYHFHRTDGESAVRRMANTGDNLALKRDAGNLPAFLLDVRTHHPHAYAAIRDAVRLVAPFLEDFILTPQGASGEFILLRWKHIGSNGYFDVADLSDGTLRFVCLATALLQPRPPEFVMIDEPELGLHPRAIHLLAELLESVAQRSQIVVATQSAQLVNWLKPEHVVVVDRLGDRETEFRRLSSAELAPWLTEYGLGDLLSNEALMLPSLSVSD